MESAGSVVTGIYVRVGVFGFGPHSIVPLERLVAPSAQNLTTIREHKIPPEISPIENRVLQGLPHRQFVTPTSSRSSKLSVTFHVTIPASTHEQKIVWGVEQFGSTHATVLPVMRHQILLNPTMPAVTVPRLHELEDFLRHRHRSSLYWVRGWMDSIDRENAQSDSVKTGVRFSAAPQI